MCSSSPGSPGYIPITLDLFKLPDSKLNMQLQMESRQISCRNKVIPARYALS